MKPIKFLPIVMIAAAGLVASCSTSKLATVKPTDDVYNTVAKAREVEPYIPPQNQAQAQQGQPVYDDEYYGTSNPYYDMDYSSRINRFYNGYSFQGYYDPYFDSTYGYNNASLGYGLGWSNGYGLGAWGGNNFWGSVWNTPYYNSPWNFGYNPWDIYSYYNRYSWGPYSNYDRFGWGGGYYGSGWGLGGGYYGGGVYTNRGNSGRPRPNRDGDNRGSYGPNGTSYAPNGNYGRPTTGTTTNRPERYGNSNGTSVSGRPTSTGVAPGGRPTRDDGGYSRPQTQSVQPASRPDRGSYSPPPTSGGGGGGGSTGGGGGGGGGSRPTRGGN